MNCLRVLILARSPTVGHTACRRASASRSPWRALVHGPRNVILDEPTNGLDVMAIRTLRDLIRGLRDEGRCVLLSSHVMQEIGALCDDLVIIGKGRVVLQGSPDDVRAATGCDNLEEAFVQLSHAEQVA